MDPERHSDTTTQPIIPRSPHVVARDGGFIPEDPLDAVTRGSPTHPEHWIHSPGAIKSHLTLSSPLPSKNRTNPARTHCRAVSSCRASEEAWRANSRR